MIGEPIMLFRDENGRARALEDRCCHRFAPLSKGRLEADGNIRCLYHCLKFSSDGRCTEIPGQDIIPDAAFVPAYEVEERHGWLWIWMGDKNNADRSLIPPAVGPDDPRYIMRPGRMDYEANYELINDNLTDFSHLSYVHSASFGASESWADERPVVRRIDRGIRVTRWVGGSDKSPVNDDAPEALRSGLSPETALFQTYDYLAPGILTMLSQVLPIELMPDDRGPPDAAVVPIMETFTSQAVTPIDDKHSRYFFAFGPWAKAGDEAADQIYEVTKLAFSEDKEIIEAQQRIINLKPGREVMTSADVGPAQMRSVIRKLIKSETAYEVTSQ